MQIPDLHTASLLRVLGGAVGTPMHLHIFWKQMDVSVVSRCWRREPWWKACLEAWWVVEESRAKSRRAPSPLLRVYCLRI